MYKVVIFDLDGTILNTIDDLADSLNYVLSKNGFPVHNVEKVKYFVGNGIPKLIERALPENIDEKTYKKILSEFLDYYKNHSAEKTAPYPGIVNCIEQLKQNGVIVAVNSNKVENTAIDLCNKYYPGIFDFVCGSRENVPVKPDPAGVYSILQKAGISHTDLCAKKQVVYVGDSDVDIQTGKNAGIDEIGVSWGFRGKEFLVNHGAETIVNNCDELLKAILS
ncbi:MAG: HAD-IA family hydrolase [Treponema sp.]|nr:HAD-IA family hydrolase [Treponema sp.]